MRYLVLVAILLWLTGCKAISNTAGISLSTTEKEARAGRAISKKVEKKFESVENWQLQQKVNGIGHRLAKVCDQPEIQYHFEVLDNQKVNAFAIPGGYIYIFKGLIDKLENDDDELAAVIAHEIGHMSARHHAKRARGSIGIGALAVLLSRIETDPQSKAQAQKALFELALSYSREDEIEADKLSVKYLKLAGFNPEGALRVLEKLKKLIFEKPIERYHPYKTHPYISDRIKAVKEDIYGSIEFEDYINVVGEN